VKKTEEDEVEENFEINNDNYEAALKEYSKPAKESWKSEAELN